MLEWDFFTRRGYESNLTATYNALVPSNLTSAWRSELRAAAHKLSPVVIIGDKGLGDSVLAEIDGALTAHELIKVKAVTDNRALREGWQTQICARLAAEPVQLIGKILVVYRLNPEKHKPARKPAAKRAVPEKKAPRRPKFKGPPPATGTSHRRSRTPSPRPESGPRRRRPNTSR